MLAILLSLLVSLTADRRWSASKSALNPGPIIDYTLYASTKGLVGCLTLSRVLGML